MPKTGFILLYCRVVLYRFYLLKKCNTDFTDLKLCWKCPIFQGFKMKPFTITIYSLYINSPYHFFLHRFRKRNLCQDYGNNFMVSFKMHFIVFVTTSVTTHFLQKLHWHIENWTFQSMSKFQNLQLLFPRFFTFSKREHLLIKYYFCSIFYYIRPYNIVV